MTVSSLLLKEGDEQHVDEDERNTRDAESKIRSRLDNERLFNLSRAMCRKATVSGTDDSEVVPFSSSSLSPPSPSSEESLLLEKNNIYDAHTKINK